MGYYETEIPNAFPDDYRDFQPHLPEICGTCGHDESDHEDWCLIIGCDCERFEEEA